LTPGMNTARHTESMPSHTVMRMPVVRFIAVIGIDPQSISVEIARQEQFTRKRPRRSTLNLFSVNVPAVQNGVWISFHILD